MADISYLFEQGMLLDYDVEELVKLLKALFAETPLRENTIRKIMHGHPVPS
jgi:centromere/kinetochore protein ZW10